MRKQLPTAGITDELAGSSVFFTAPPVAEQVQDAPIPDAAPFLDADQPGATMPPITALAGGDTVADIVQRARSQSYGQCLSAQQERRVKDSGGILAPSVFQGLAQAAAGDATTILMDYDEDFAVWGQATAPKGAAAGRCATHAGSALPALGAVQTPATLVVHLDWRRLALVIECRKLG